MSILDGKSGPLTIVWCQITTNDTIWQANDVKCCKQEKDVTCTVFCAGSGVHFNVL